MKYITTALIIVSAVIIVNHKLKEPTTVSPEVTIKKALNLPATDATAIDETRNVAATTNQVVNETPTKATGIQQRADWRVNGNFMQHYAQLEAMFLGGDLIAGYKIAKNLLACRRAPKDQQSMQQAIDKAQALQETPDYFQRLESRFEKCQGISPQLNQQYHRYLYQVANEGYVPAQETYAAITTEFYMQTQATSSLKRQQYLELKEAFIKEKLTMLERAASHGSLLAIISLANLYYSQNYGKNGSLKAYAYNQLILELTTDNQLYNRYQWYQQKLESSLSPQQISQALDISSAILSKINNNGTIYPLN